MIMNKPIILFFLGYFLAGCSEVIIPADFHFNKEENFKLHLEYLSSDNNLKVEIINIEDSRCPSDVVCVWQGEARVEIVLEETQTFSTVLSTYDNQVDTLGNYSLELIDVKPYPVSDKVIKTEDYDVTLKIKRITQTG